MADLEERYAAFLRELQLEQAAAPPPPARTGADADGRRRRAALAATLGLVDDYVPSGTDAEPDTAAGGGRRPRLRVVS
jgi:hypothetical protein